ncbi:unnamed protein product [Ectocarpus sp. CCAP 1310/34]|nr:unnamed protein product [Ectocarpus sp. CCAP 1310/34]
MSSTWTTMIMITRPSSINRKTHASARHCKKPKSNKHLVRCACQCRDACFKPYRLLHSFTIRPDNLPHPCGKRMKTSSSSSDCTKAC